MYLNIFSTFFDIFKPTHYYFKPTQYYFKPTQYYFFIEHALQSYTLTLRPCQKGGGSLERPPPAVPRFRNPPPQLLNGEISFLHLLHQSKHNLSIIFAKKI